MSTFQSRPGLENIGENPLDEAKITVIEYDADHHVVREVESVEGCRTLANAAHAVTWLNFDGEHPRPVYEALQTTLGLHPLVLDAVESSRSRESYPAPGTRPRLEDFGDALFVLIKMIYWDAASAKVLVEPVAIVLGKDYVVTFQERTGDVFGPVRERLAHARSRLRRQGADELLYALLDAVVDNYFLALEAIGEMVEELDENVTEDPTKLDARRLHVLKREVLYLRKALVPARELLASLSHIDSELVSDACLVYLRDVSDHVVQATETVDVHREILASLLDVYHSSLSNRMNEIMKVLTMISTLFIPLTFLAGIYGMNFDVMPELRWTYGYPMVWAVMIAVAIALFYLFRRRGWF